jgi:hypothetical protein
MLCIGCGLMNCSATRMEMAHIAAAKFGSVPLHYCQQNQTKHARRIVISEVLGKMLRQWEPFQLALYLDYAGAADKAVNLVGCKSPHHQLPGRVVSISDACGGNEACSARR